MASRGVVCVFLLSALPLLCLELQRGVPDFGIKDLILLCGRIFLLLALLTLIISVAASLLNSFKSSHVYLKEEEEKNEKRQKLVRKRQQEEQGEKASRYIENVLKPHQEMRLKKLEERFYQVTGETWKLTSGHKLGGDEELVLENASWTSFETTNREAAKRRNLPKPLTKVSPPAEPFQKQVPDLPEEPSETTEGERPYLNLPGFQACDIVPVVQQFVAEGPWITDIRLSVVTVALRCLSGNVLRRRFFKTWSSQVLFDWMMKIGYHTSLYGLSTSFPRRPLEVEQGRSLADVGITVDTVLNVEEKEQSNW